MNIHEDTASAREAARPRSHENDMDGEQKQPQLPLRMHIHANGLLVAINY